MRTLVLRFDGTARFKIKQGLGVSGDRLREVDPTGRAVGLHKRSHVDGVAPDVESDAALADDAGYDRPGVNADPQVERRPTAANRNAISVVENLNRQHEQNHLDTTKAAFHKLKDDLEKRMVGQTKNEADATFDEMTSALRGACQTLHSTEGSIEVDALLHATVKAQGAGGCD